MVLVTVHPNNNESTIKQSNANKNNFASILQRFPLCETYRNAQMKKGLDEELCKRLDRVARPAILTPPLGTRSEDTRRIRNEA